MLTRVGGDPVVASAPATDGPYIAQFSLRSSVRGGVALAETNKAKVTVVGHTPRFDATRNLWYCDIELDPGAAYQPFVRLALCRYQPHSIDGHHISRWCSPTSPAAAAAWHGASGAACGSRSPVPSASAGWVAAASTLSDPLEPMVTAEIQQLPKAVSPPADGPVSASRSTSPSRVAAAVSGTSV